MGLTSFGPSHGLEKTRCIFVRLGVDLRLVVERCGMAKMIPVRVKGEGVLLSVLLRDVGILDICRLETCRN